MSPSVAAITIAPSTALGRFWNSGARRTAVARIRPAVISEESCDLAPAASAVAVWREAGVGREAAEQAGREVRGAEGHHLLVGIDLVPALGRVGAAGADRLAHGQEHDPGRAEDEVGDRGQRDRGIDGSGTPVATSPTTLTS